jgi:hypothetical protein
MIHNVSDHLKITNFINRRQLRQPKYIFLFESHIINEIKSNGLQGGPITNNEEKLFSELSQFVQMRCVTYDKGKQSNVEATLRGAVRFVRSTVVRNTFCSIEISSVRLCFYKLVTLFNFEQ